MWTKFFETSWPECKLHEGASRASIEKLEDELNVPIPLPLQQLFLETDGVSGPDGSAVIFSLEDLLDCNVDLWLNTEYEGVYVPLESYLFFGEARGDSLFAYPILGDRPDKSKVFRWQRDTDSRIYYANGLEQYFYMRWKCFEVNDAALWDQQLTIKDFDDYQLFLNQGEDHDFSPDASSQDMTG